MAPKSKPAPWKVDPSAKRFEGPGANRHIPKFHPPKGLIESNGFQNIKPSWETTMAESYGPTNSTVLANERMKKMSALDEAVTSVWSTTQEAIGKNDANREINQGIEQAKRDLAEKRSKVVYNTHQPWSTSYDTLGKDQPLDVEKKKKVAQDKKTFFPEKIDYATTQDDYGSFIFGRHRGPGSKSARPMRHIPRPENLQDKPPLDPWKTSNGTFGNHQDGFVPNRRARTMEMEDRHKVRALTPLDYDILGKVVTENEAEEFKKAYTIDQHKDLSSIAFNTFMFTEAAKGKPYKKESSEPDFSKYPKSTAWKVRKQLQQLNIDPNKL